MASGKILKDSCDHVVEFSYMKPFDSDEISEYKHELSEIMIRLADIQAEFDIVKEKHKEAVNPLNKQIKQYVDFIRNKAQLVKEECYIMYEEQYAVYYNSDGEEVFRRPLEPSERQKTIFMEGRKTS